MATKVISHEKGTFLTDIKEIRRRARQHPRRRHRHCVCSVRNPVLAAQARCQRFAMKVSS